MEPIDAATVGEVLDVMHAERREFVSLLRSLDEAAWAAPTECPAYPVKGVATHVLGDDLSLLSRQRDGAVQGLVLMAETMPGSDFRALLNGFNDQWVEAARFLSVEMVCSLLEMTGEWTEAFYRSVDPLAPCEPVPLFGPAPGETSPYWQAIAREYLERWAHHSQILRALGRPSLAATSFLSMGLRIVAGAAGLPAEAPGVSGGGWRLGPLTLGPAQQAADILTLAHTSDEVVALVDGPAAAVAEFSTRVGRRDG